MVVSSGCFLIHKPSESLAPFSIVLIQAQSYEGGAVMSVAKQIDCQAMDVRKRRPFKNSKPLSGDHLALIKAASEKSQEQYAEAYKELATR